MMILTVKLPADTGATVIEVIEALVSDMADESGSANSTGEASTLQQAPAGQNVSAETSESEAHQEMEQGETEDDASHSPFHSLSHPRIHHRRKQF